MGKLVQIAAWPETPTVPGMAAPAAGTSQPTRGEHVLNQMQRRGSHVRVVGFYPIKLGLNPNITGFKCS